MVWAFLLRDAIEDFMISEIRSQKLGKASHQKEKESQNYSIDNNELTVDDWEELREMKDILEPFRKWSLILQGKPKNRCLFDIFPAIDELLLHLENSITWFTDTPYQYL